MKRIYLDYAASTPVDPAVFDAMKPYFTEKFGNPGSLHSFGQEAIAAVDHSREMIGKAIGAQFREVIFTASATEANNLAILGAVIRYISTNAGKKPKVILSPIEHESILEAARSLSQWGVEVVYLPVDHKGRVDIKAFEKLLDDQTALVSVMHGNNEIGTIEPIEEIARVIAEWKKENKSKTIYPLLHTDAAQTFQFLDCNVKTLGVDMMTLSSHKIYGPKGAAALYIKEGTPLRTQIYGGGQEFGMRSGTENVPAIVGFAKAVEMTIPLREKEMTRIGALRDGFWDGIKKIFPDAEINGPVSGKNKLPNILNVYFPGLQAQDILTRFDRNGVAASSGSACRSRAFESSYVIEVLGYSRERAKASVRFSLGRPTIENDIEETLKILKLF